METKTRTIIKALTFRIMALAITIPFVGWKIALWLQLILLAVYYVHERFWMRIHWGKN